MRWSFSPDPEPEQEVRKPYRPRSRKTSWTSPDHAKEARYMDRGYPRDDLGRKVSGSGKELILDTRPTILVPPRPTIMGWK